MSLFLSLEDIIDLHDQQIEVFGGLAGIRDRNLLESAIQQPAGHFFGVLLHPTLLAQAAAYLYYLALNHAFVDGNKRTAAYACLVFLDVNDHPTLPEPEALFALVTEMVEQRLDKGRVIERLITICSPVLASEEEDFEFWRQIDTSKLSEATSGTDNPWAHRLMVELRRALIANGMIGLLPGKGKPWLGFEANGGFVCHDLLFVKVPPKDHERLAALAGLEPHESLLPEDALSGHVPPIGVSLCAAFVRCGVFSIHFDTPKSQIGWRGGDEPFTFRDLSFVPLEIHSRRAAAQEFGIDLTFDPLD